MFQKISLQIIFLKILEHCEMFYIFLFAGHLSLAIILLVLVAKSIAITYLDKCYCPGKDPYLSRDKNLRNKMYALKSVFTSEKLDIWWRKGKS